MRALTECWLCLFGPMETIVSDQEGALTSDMVGAAFDRHSIKRELAGSNPNRTQRTTAGLVAEEPSLRSKPPEALTSEQGHA